MCLLSKYTWEKLVINRKQDPFNIDRSLRFPLTFLLLFSYNKMKLASFKRPSFWFVKFVSRSSMFSSNLKNAVLLRSIFFWGWGGLFDIYILFDNFFISKLHVQGNEFWFEIWIIQMEQLLIRDYFPYSLWQAASEKNLLRNPILIFLP